MQNVFFHKHHRIVLDGAKIILPYPESQIEYFHHLDEVIWLSAY